MTVYYSMKNIITCHLISSDKGKERKCRKRGREEARSVRGSLWHPPGLIPESLAFSRRPPTRPRRPTGCSRNADSPLLPASSHCAGAQGNQDGGPRARRRFSREAEGLWTELADEAGDLQKERDCRGLRNGFTESRGAPGALRLVGASGTGAGRAGPGKCAGRPARPSLTCGAIFTVRGACRASAPGKTRRLGFQLEPLQTAARAEASVVLPPHLL